MENLAAFFSEHIFLLLVIVTAALILLLKPARKILKYIAGNTIFAGFYAVLSIALSPLGILPLNFGVVALAFVLGLPGVCLGLFLELLLK